MSILYALLIAANHDPRCPEKVLGAVLAAEEVREALPLLGPPPPRPWPSLRGGCGAELGAPIMGCALSESQPVGGDACC